MFHKTYNFPNDQDGQIIAKVVNKQSASTKKNKFKLSKSSNFDKQIKP